MGAYQQGREDGEHQGETDRRVQLVTDPGFLTVAVGHYQVERADNDAMWRDVLSKAPNSSRAHLNYAEALSDQARKEQSAPLLAEAEQHYRRATELNPDTFEAWYNLGNLYYSRAHAVDPLSREELNAAVEAYTRALAIAPKYPEARINLGNVYSDLGRPPPLSDITPGQIEWLQKAIEQYRVVADMAPGRWNRTLVARARFNMANQYHVLGDMDGAAEWYRSATEADPTYPRARHLLAQIYDKWRQYDLAIELLDAELEINENNREAFLLKKQLERKRDAQ